MNLGQLIGELIVRAECAVVVPPVVPAKYSKRGYTAQIREALMSAPPEGLTLQQIKEMVPLVPKKKINSCLYMMRDGWSRGPRGGMVYSIDGAVRAGDGWRRLMAGAR